MADKNFYSFEEIRDGVIGPMTLIPTHPLDYADTAKFWKCDNSIFHDFMVVGGREDVADIGQNTNECIFRNWLAKSNGKYVFTIKGDSDHNTFENIEISRGGGVVDVDINNWHSFDFGSSRHLTFINVWRHDGKPVTFRYRFFAGKPVFKNTKYKILWFQSLGLTIFWWAKYFWHVVLKRPDNAVSPQ